MVILVDARNFHGEMGDRYKLLVTCFGNLEPVLSGIPMADAI